MRFGEDIQPSTMKPKTKKYLFRSIALVIMTVIGLLLFDRWDKAENRDYEFGYYGVFNRITHCLESMPEVSAVTATAVNIDIALEEFGLDVTLKNGRTAKLYFQERDPIRSLSGQELTASLKALLVPQGIGSNAETMVIKRLPL